MRIEASTYDDDLYFLGYDDEITERQIRSSLESNYASLHDGLFEIVTRRQAEASDTNNAADLDVFSELFNSYDRVEVVRVRVE